MINARKTANSKAFTSRNSYSVASSRNKSTNSFTIRNSRSSIRAQDRSDRSFTTAQKVVLCVIGILALIIVVMTIVLLRFDEKYQVEAKISDLARDYYEEYYYPTAFGSDEALAANFLSRFADIGLTSVSLRQMLSIVPNVSEKERDLIEQHCNQNTTFVIFYPKSPFSANSYDIDLQYSCDFE